MKGMTDQAREARRAYKRKWNREHADKVKAAQIRYWNNKAAEQTTTGTGGTEK